MEVSYFSGRLLKLELVSKEAEFTTYEAETLGKVFGGQLHIQSYYNWDRKYEGHKRSLGNLFIIQRQVQTKELKTDHQKKHLPRLLLTAAPQSPSYIHRYVTNDFFCQSDIGQGFQRLVVFLLLIDQT